MDALPVTEATGLPYSSEVEGVMHACGHDVHVSTLLGAAKLMADGREAWSGTYIALFQPAEEIGAGSQAMVDDGLVTKVPRPDVALSQHVMPIAAGTLATTAGPVLSAGDSLKITVLRQGRARLHAAHVRGPGGAGVLDRAAAADRCFARDEAGRLRRGHRGGARTRVRNRTSSRTAPHSC